MNHPSNQTLTKFLYRDSDISLLITELSFKTITAVNEWVVS